MRVSAVGRLAACEALINVPWTDDARAGWRTSAVEDDPNGPYSQFRPRSL